MGTKFEVNMNNIDKVLATLGVFFSIILIVYLTLLSFRIIYILSIILVLISCSLWLLIRKTHRFDFNIPNSSNVVLILMICFFALFSLSFLIWFSRPEIYERPISYFLLTSIMAGVITFEIFISKNKYTVIILIQVIILAISIAWSQLLLFPDLIGVDPWYHSMLTNRIVNEGTIPIEYSYSKLPLFHLFIGSTSIITTLPYKLSAMLSVSICQILCNVLFIFLIASILFKNHKIGLLASLFVVIADQHIYMSYWSIPNGFAVIFIPIVLYIIIRQMEPKTGSQYNVCLTIIMFLSMASIIFSHSVAALGMAIILFVAWISLVVCRSTLANGGKGIALSVPIGFVAAMISWWAYESGHMRTLKRLIEWGFSVDVFKNPNSSTINYIATTPLAEQIFNQIGMYLFFALSIIGFFYMISRKGTPSTFMVAWAGLVPLAISFFSLISGHSIIEHRWWYLAQVLLSIPLAIAIYLIGTWNYLKTSHNVSFVSGIVLIISLVMILSPTANVDNHLFSSNTAYTPTLVESELYSINAIIEMYDGVIGTDGYVQHRNSFMISESEFIDLDVNIYKNNFSALPMDLLLIREKITSSTFNLFGSIYKLDYDLKSSIHAQNYSKIYQSNSVSIFIKI